MPMLHLAQDSFDVVGDGCPALAGVGDRVGEIGSGRDGGNRPEIESHSLRWRHPSIRRADSREREFSARRATQFLSNLRQSPSSPALTTGRCYV